MFCESLAQPCVSRTREVLTELSAATIFAAQSLAEEHLRQFVVFLTRRLLVSECRAGLLAICVGVTTHSYNAEMHSVKRICAG